MLLEERVALGRMLVLCLGVGIPTEEDANVSELNNV